MARQNHALNTNGSYGRLFHFLHFFHFSKRFETKETLPISSKNQSSKNRNRCSKPPSKQHQTLREESEEKTKQIHSTFTSFYILVLSSLATVVDFWGFIP
ncbi:hypothetical protein AHAS_Ahas16G0269800 [Arachis hypogaea]